MIRLLTFGRIGFILVFSLAGLRTSRGLAADNLIVHEWGTFTSLQDEQGRELWGINTDDEPVPKFVHNLNPFVLSKPLLSSQHWIYRQKAVPRVHPYVTMRLETPVLYFYSPKSWNSERTIDVSVQFRGGWLTEFYPRAKADAPGLSENKFQFGPLTPQTISSLSWERVQIGSPSIGPVTDEHVWLAPRQVAASNLQVGDESERFLFYRGVGRQRAPLRATLERKSGELMLHSNFDEVLRSDETSLIQGLWVVHIRQDGRCAFRELEPLRITGDHTALLASTYYRFGAEDYQLENQFRLAQAMHPRLVADGLNSDEATALLSTWKRSYFASPGLRLFYLVPRVWTDYYLPLNLSVEAEVQRVMVGRLELISDEQRAGLDHLREVKVSDGKWLKQIAESPARDQFLAGRSGVDLGGIAIPADFQAYLDLGRFRNALVVHEEQARSSANLAKFIQTYSLQPFLVPADDQAASPTAVPNNP